MNIFYKIWINAHFPTQESAKLNCDVATSKMVSDFPNLIKVRGLAHVEEPYGLPPTKTPHWWCKDEKGDIIDPTAHQYPTQILKYEEADESKGPPTGKCPNCGGLCYEGSYLCSAKCNKEYMDYLNNPNNEY